MADGIRHQEPLHLNLDHVGRMDTANRPTASCETSCSMARSSTAIRKPRRSSRNGASTTTLGDPIRRSVTDLPHYSPSRRHHQPSTGHQSCNNLSLRLVQNIGQASRNGRSRRLRPGAAQSFNSRITLGLIFLAHALGVKPEQPVGSLPQLRVRADHHRQLELSVLFSGCCAADRFTGFQPSRLTMAEMFTAFQN
jgi:hypothetical protein